MLGPLPPPPPPRVCVPSTEHQPCAYTLPVFAPLTAASPRTEFVQSWEAYLAKVYHQPIANAHVDLNRFSWFYKDAPLSSLHCFHTCIAEVDTETDAGTPWVGPKKYPEGVFEMAGFFVRRPFPSHASYENCDKLEIGHVAF